MLEKEVYEKPELKVIKFEIKDSIAQSVNGVLYDEWFYRERIRKKLCLSLTVSALPFCFFLKFERKGMGN